MEKINGTWRNDGDAQGDYFHTIDGHDYVFVGIDVDEAVYFRKAGFPDASFVVVDCFVEESKEV